MRFVHVFLLVGAIGKKRSSSSDTDGLMVVVGMMILGVCLKAADYPNYYIWMWLGNLVVFIYANRGKLYKYWKEKTNRRITYRY